LWDAAVDAEGSDAAAGLLDEVPGLMREMLLARGEVNPVVLGEGVCPEQAGVRGVVGDPGPAEGDAGEGFDSGEQAAGELGVAGRVWRVRWQGLGATAAAGDDAGGRGEKRARGERGYGRCAEAVSRLAARAL